MNKPDWDLWAFIPGVKLWQACALSMNIDPDSFDPDANVYPVEQREARQLFSKRLRIATAQMENKKFRFSRRSNDWDRKYEIYLANFAAWATNEIKWDNLPPEFVAMAQGQPANAHEQESAGSTDDDNDKEIAELFDPVSPAQLDVMFPSDGEWKKWAERAARNGLAEAARTNDARGMFNPYYAAKWWLQKQRPKGWGLEKCLKKLANNLPARSQDSRERLVGYCD